MVHDELNVKFFGHVFLDGVEEVAELHRNDASAQ
jgi:hypothetical protein